MKIINATYKLLDFFPDNEPLKYKAKEKALKILENLSLISDASGWASLQKEKARAELLDDIEVLKNYLQLGKYQGWVGGINFLILLKEYDKIKSQITPQKYNIGDKLVIAQRAEPAKLGPSLQAGSKPPLISEQLLKNNKSKEILLKTIYLQSSGVGADEKQDKTSERQKKILSIISSMGRAQVSDIIKEVSNVTKRTIRRDLDELLKKSKIIRSGEWNKVSYQMN